MIEVATTANWHITVNNQSKDLGEFNIETSNGDIIIKMMMTKDMLWRLAKAAMDTADYLNNKSM